MLSLKDVLDKLGVPEERQSPIFGAIAVEERDGKYVIFIKPVLKDLMNKYKDLLTVLGDYEIIEVSSRSTGPRIAVMPASELPAGEHGRPESEDSGTDMVRVTGRLLGDALNPGMTMNRFIVSYNNEDAYNAVLSVLNAQDGTSVLIYGLPGVGKTHLLQATGWLALYEGVDVAHFTSASLIKTIIESFKQKNTHAVINKIALGRLLLIDDFQQFNKQSLRNLHDALFYLIDKVLLKGGKVIVTSDTKTSDWSFIHPRILQRVKLHGEIPIRIPDSSFAEAFFREKLHGRVSDDVISYLAQLPFNSIRDLISIVNVIETAARRKRLASVSDVVPIVRMVMGGNAAPVSESSLKTKWRDFLLATGQLDDHDLQAVLKGSYNKLPIETKRIVSMLRTAFVSVARARGYRTKTVADAIGVVSRYIPRLLKHEDKYRHLDEYKWFKKVAEEMF